MDTKAGIETRLTLVDGRVLADCLGVSIRHVRRMDAAGLLPGPVRLGGAVRWVAADIEGWLRAGCPDRQSWERSRAPASCGSCCESGAGTDSPAAMGSMADANEETP